MSRRWYYLGREEGLSRHHLGVTAAPGMKCVCAMANFNTCPLPFLYIYIQVVCQPETIALGSPVFVNLEYHNAMSRPMSVHVDLMNADTNAWIAGDAVKVS